MPRSDDSFQNLSDGRLMVAVETISFRFISFRFMSCALRARNGTSAQSSL